MGNWQDEKIRNIAGWYIQKASMDPGSWRYTRLLDCHRALLRVLPLQAGELVIVTSLISQSSWYALTTRRALGSYNGATVDLLATDVSEPDFNNFKGYRGAETEIMTLVQDGSQSTQLEYETGKASMAPIYYFRFWDIKYPVLDKLKDRPLPVPAERDGWSKA